VVHSLNIELTSLRKFIRDRHHHNDTNIHLQYQENSNNEGTNLQVLVSAGIYEGKRKE
jgi:hypothetical protein